MECCYHGYHKRHSKLICFPQLWKVALCVMNLTIADITSSLILVTQVTHAAIVPGKVIPTLFSTIGPTYWAEMHILHQR